MSRIAKPLTDTEIKNQNIHQKKNLKFLRKLIQIFKEKINYLMEMVYFLLLEKLEQRCGNLILNF